MSGMLCVCFCALHGDFSHTTRRRLGEAAAYNRSAPRVYYGDKTSHDDEPHVVAHAECSQNHQSLTQLSISWRVVLTYVLPSATQHLNLQSCARGMVCCRPWQARQTSA